MMRGCPDRRPSGEGRNVTTYGTGGISMLKRAGIVALGLIFAAGLAGAGGGKVKWTECKGDKDFDRVAAECKQYGQSMVIYFSSDS